MSPERNWRMRVKDILECIGQIDRYTWGKTYDQFIHDDMTFDAIIRNF